MINRGVLWTIAGLTLMVGCTPDKPKENRPDTVDKSVAKEKSTVSPPEKRSYPLAEPATALPSEPPAITPATEWVRSLTARRECNRVMGCPAMDKLVSMGKEALGDLHRVLDGSPPIAPFRPVVIETIGKIGEPSSSPWLLKEMSAPLWPNRVEACIALGRVGDKSAIPELLKVVKRDGDWMPPTIAGAAYALHRLGDSSYIHEILAISSPEAIATMNWGYTRFGIQLGTELKLKEILPGARAGLGHGDYFLREASLIAVDELNDKESVMLLLPLLEDKVPSIRKKADALLAKWAGKAMGSPEAWKKWCIAEKHCPPPRP